MNIKSNLIRSHDSKYGTALLQHSANSALVNLFKNVSSKQVNALKCICSILHKNDIHLFDEIH